jgi:hypothetical protein
MSSETGGVGWGFSTIDPIDHRSGDDVAQYALEKELSVFVREVLQNSNDERLDESAPVRVRFDIKTLRDDELDDFLEALDWQTWERHLELAGEELKTDQLQRFMEEIEEEEELRLLTVEDSNTRGLLGAEDARSSNFTALVRDSLYSEKQDDGAGGSFGLGASVLWTFSGLSTVLFNSVLSEPDPRDESPRFIGRTRLPPHRSEGGDEVHPGHGWFGTRGDRGRPISVWGEEAGALAETLYSKRNGECGTSATILGFNDPTAEDRLSDDELAEEIREQAVRWFWPAIQQGELEVTVQTRESELEATLDTSHRVQPSVECLSEWRDPDESLDGPGATVLADIPLDVPDKNDEETESGQLSLVVRLAGPDDPDWMQNHVALFRGPGMVVKYERFEKVAVGDTNFHAALVCGRARGWSGTPSQADLDVESFLRAAEPPEHNEWKRTEELAKTYQPGFRKAVEGIRGRVKDELRSLLAPNVQRGALGPRKLGKRFPLDRGGAGLGGGPPTGRHVEGSTSVSFDATERRWEFDGEVVPLRPGDTIDSIGFGLSRLSEEGRQTRDTLDIESVELRLDSAEDPVTVDDPNEEFELPDGTTRVEISGRSAVDYDRTQTRLTVQTAILKRGDD